MSIEQEKQLAAEPAADLVEHGMTVGLGTGSTVAFLFPPEMVATVGAVNCSHRTLPVLGTR